MGEKRTCQLSIKLNGINTYLSRPDWESIDFADEFGLWFWALDLGTDQADYASRMSLNDTDYGLKYIHPRSKSRLDINGRDTVYARPGNHWPDYARWCGTPPGSPIVFIPGVKPSPRYGRIHPLNV